MFRLLGVLLFCALVVGVFSEDEAALRAKLQKDLEALRAKLDETGGAPASRLDQAAVRDMRSRSHARMAELRQKVEEMRQSHAAAEAAQANAAPAPPSPEQQALEQRLRAENAAPRQYHPNMLRDLNRRMRLHMDEQERDPLTKLIPENPTDPLARPIRAKTKRMMERLRARMRGRDANIAASNAALEEEEAANAEDNLPINGPRGRTVQLPPRGEPLPAHPSLLRAQEPPVAPPRDFKIEDAERMLRKLESHRREREAREAEKKKATAPAA